MEGSSTLYLSKDTFYLAILLVKTVFEPLFLKKSSEKVIETFAAACLSIAAKMENSVLNFP